ncbi:MAG: AraC family transcriptional regulator [Clostridia bacterium]|nr:AraC family transcriptional regulator [Clostridia bacterium]
MSINHIIKLAQYKTDSGRLPLHFHTDHEIIFVKEGVVEIVVNGKSIIASKGDMVFLSNFESHSTNIIKTPYKRYTITISPSVFEDQIDDISLISMFKNRSSDFNHIIHMNSFDLIQIWLDKIISELTSQIEDKYTNELQLMYLKEILIYAFREQSNSVPISDADKDITKLIFHVQSVIDDHYTENIKISDICKNVHVSAPYFSQKFKTLTGYSPKQYLTHIRLNHAANEIISSKGSVTDIAFDAGFSDINNFHRKFKERFLLTPVEFRKKYIDGTLELYPGRL